MIARSVPAVTWGSLLRNALAAMTELLGHPTKPRCISLAPLALRLDNCKQEGIVKFALLLSATSSCFCSAVSEKSSGHS